MSTDNPSQVAIASRPLYFVGEITLYGYISGSEMSISNLAKSVAISSETL